MAFYNYVYIICFNGNTPDRMHGTFDKHCSFVRHYKWLQPLPIPWTNDVRPQQKVLMIASVRGGANQEQKLREIFSNWKMPQEIELAVCHYQNWGGTIGALWDGWRYLKSNGITAQYVMVSEDDWISNSWPLRERLLDEGFICVGHQLGTVDDTHLLFMRNGYRSCPIGTRSTTGTDWFEAKYKPDKWVWMDGGFYFFKYEGLQQIEDKIGPFTKAPQDQPYCWQRDGVGYGELCFPWELHYNGFKIIMLGPGTTGGAVQFTEGSPFIHN